MRGRKVLFVGAFLALALVVAAPTALAACWTNQGGGSSSVGSTGPGGSFAPGQTVSASLTGYSYFDNTPAGSADICCPVLHRRAGGRGTYTDPITVAVPGSGASMQLPAGTRVYVSSLRRYLIVEDSGATREAGRYHFDVWVDGAGYGELSSQACMDELTDTVSVVLNPRPGYPVTVGPLTGSNGCRL